MLSKTFVILIALALVSTALTLSACHPLWHYHDGNCYFVTKNTKAAFNESEQVCTGLGAHLVSIHDKAEDEFVVDIINNSSDTFSLHWIGAYNQSWTDRSAWDYNNWFTNQPVYKCGLILVNGNANRWFTANCDYHADFVCKKEANLEFRSI
ncbi:hypothetical protein L596_028935 [Steinernema carpocapsae]|uniref:C-type lectin domain-containing protein n=1 Tax=Steinernema carpocapsae TaxID=34508 RepID=A0A4U5LZU2_STECR|nr:hypothetical protein L596_028935 [Steinernema carpocapsae]